MDLLQQNPPPTAPISRLLHSARWSGLVWPAEKPGTGRWPTRNSGLGSCGTPATNRPSKTGPGLGSGGLHGSQEKRPLDAMLLAVPR